MKCNKKYSIKFLCVVGKSFLSLPNYFSVVFYLFLKQQVCSGCRLIFFVQLVVITRAYGLAFSQNSRDLGYCRSWYIMSPFGSKYPYNKSVYL